MVGFGVGSFGGSGFGGLFNLDLWLDMKYVKPCDYCHKMLTLDERVIDSEYVCERCENPIDGNRAFFEWLELIRSEPYRSIMVEKIRLAGNYSSVRFNYEKNNYEYNFMHWIDVSEPVIEKASIEAENYVVLKLKENYYIQVYGAAVSYFYNNAKVDHEGIYLPRAIFWKKYFTEFELDQMLIQYKLKFNKLQESV